MKALVTGGLGLIGSHISKRLLEKGYTVRILDIRDFNEYPFYSKYKLDDKLEFVHGDIVDVKTCQDAMIGIDVVFHTAAIARTNETVSDPMRAHDVNATGTLNLLLAARDNKVKRFIHSSSSILYVPYTPYFVGKQCAESYVSIFSSLYGMSTISLRYANVFGPGQRRDGAYPNVLAAMAKSKEENGYITVYGDGKQNRSFIHVDDVVDANILALRVNTQRPLDIGSNIYTSVNELAAFFDCPIHYGEARRGDVYTIKISTKEAKEDLNFEAKIELNRESLKSYL